MVVQKQRGVGNTRKKGWLNRLQKRQGLVELKGGWKNKGVPENQGVVVRGREREIPTHRDVDRFLENWGSVICEGDKGQGRWNGGRNLRFDGETWRGRRKKKRFGEAGSAWSQS